MTNKTSRKPDQPDQPKPKKWFNEAILIASIAGLATLIGGALTFYSSYLSTQQARVQSCIQRIDTQEAKTREKAEVLLGSLGDLFGKTGNPELPLSESYLAIQKVMKSSYELTAYSPPELSLIALNIASFVKDKISVKTDDQKKTELSKTSSAFAEWPINYYKYMEEFQKKRDECKSS